MQTRPRLVQSFVKVETKTHIVVEFSPKLKVINYKNFKYFKQYKIIRKLYIFLLYSNFGYSLILYNILYKIGLFCIMHYTKIGFFV